MCCACAVGKCLFPYVIQPAVIALFLGKKGYLYRNDYKLLDNRKILLGSIFYISYGDRGLIILKIQYYPIYIIYKSIYASILFKDNIIPAISHCSLKNVRIALKILGLFAISDTKKLYNAVSSNHENSFSKNLRI